MEKLGNDKIALFLACASVLGGKAQAINTNKSQSPQSVAAVGEAVTTSKKMGKLTKSVIIASSSIVGAGLIYEVLGDTIINKAPTLFKLLRGNLKNPEEKQSSPGKIEEKQSSPEEIKALAGKILNVINSFGVKDSIESITNEIKKNKGNKAKTNTTAIRQYKIEKYGDRIKLEHCLNNKNNKKKVEDDEALKIVFRDYLDLDVERLEDLQADKKNENEKENWQTTKYSVNGNCIRFYEENGSYFNYEITNEGNLQIEAHDYNYDVKFILNKLEK